MRQKRAKTYKKYIHIYSTIFGFREPFQVLVDSEMCRVASSFRTDLIHQFEIVLQGRVKPMITQCCIEELYREGPSLQGAVDIAKSFERRKCNHREAIDGSGCLQSVIGESNKHRYVIATQSKILRETLRLLPGVPLLLMDRSVMVLERPSDATLKAKFRAEEDSLLPASIRAEVKEAPEEQQKKKRGPKAPNPLSMKKKQKVRQEPPPPRRKHGTDEGSAGTKRGRGDGDAGTSEKKRVKTAS